MGTFKPKINHNTCIMLCEHVRKKCCPAKGYCKKASQMCWISPSESDFKFSGWLSLLYFNLFRVRRISLPYITSYCDSCFKCFDKCPKGAIKIDPAEKIME